MPVVLHPHLQERAGDLVLHQGIDQQPSLA
jgi:hypothetical protein